MIQLRDATFISVLFFHFTLLFGQQAHRTGIQFSLKVNNYRLNDAAGLDGQGPRRRMNRSCILLAKRISSYAIGPV